MPETKKHALKRAKKHHFPSSSVVRGKKGYYILPHGIKPHSDAAKAYIHSRDSGHSPTYSSKVAWTVERKH